MPRRTWTLILGACVATNWWGVLATSHALPRIVALVGLTLCSYVLGRNLEAWRTERVLDGALRWAERDPGEAVDG